MSFYEDSSCKASPPFPPSDKLEYCLETTAKKLLQSETATQRHNQLQLLLSCSTAVIPGGKNGGLVLPPPLVLHTQN